MNSEKYIGLDVHQATISVAVMDFTGKLVMESILETKAATILQFFAGLRGTLSVTFEEGTCAGWLYDLLKPHVAKLLVCNPRKNALLKERNKNDRIDVRKLAELLRGNHLKPVYHGETGVRMWRQLSRSYLTIVKDLSRVMNRLKALYRSWAIPCYVFLAEGKLLTTIRESNEKDFVAAGNGIVELLLLRPARHRHRASGAHQRRPAKSGHGNHYLPEIQWTSHQSPAGMVRSWAGR